MVQIELLPTTPEVPRLTGRKGYFKEKDVERLRRIIRSRYGVEEVYFKKIPVCSHCYRPFNPELTEADCKEFCCKACEWGY